MNIRGYAELCKLAYTESTDEISGIEYMRRGQTFVFRGTDDIRDVITDVRILPWYTPGLG